MDEGDGESPTTLYERKNREQRERQLLLQKEAPSLARKAMSATSSATRRAASAVRGLGSLTSRAASSARKFNSSALKDARSAVREPALNAVTYLGDQVKGFESHVGKAFPFVAIMFTAIFQAMLFVFSRTVLGLPVVQTIQQIEERKRPAVLSAFEILELEPLYKARDLNEVHQSFIAMMAALSKDPNANYDLLLALLMGVEGAPHYYKERYQNEFMIEDLINLGFDTTHIDTKERRVKKHESTSEFFLIHSILKTGMVKVPLLPMHDFYKFVMLEAEHTSFNMFLDLFEMNQDKMGYLQSKVELFWLNRQYASHIQYVNDRRRDWIELNRVDATDTFTTYSQQQLKHSRVHSNLHPTEKTFTRTYPTSSLMLHEKQLIDFVDADGNFSKQPPSWFQGYFPNRKSPTDKPFWFQTKINGKTPQHPNAKPDVKPTFPFGPWHTLPKPQKQIEEEAKKAAEIEAEQREFDKEMYERWAKQNRGFVKRYVRGGSKHRRKTRKII